MPQYIDILDCDIEYQKKKYNCYTRAERINRLSIFSNENKEKPTRAEAQFLTALYQTHKYLELSQKIDIGSIYTQQIIASNTAKTGYILDFYLPRINLAFEVDGSFHDNRKEYDKLRDEYISTKGLRIIRYRNEEVFVFGFRDRLRKDINTYLKERYPKGHADLPILPHPPKGTMKEYFYKSHMKERHLMWR